MKTNSKLFLLIVMMSMSLLSFSQDFSKIKIDPIKEKKFQPYVAVRHGGGQEFNTWKENNKYQYVKEMWYFTESFYIKRNANAEGVTLDESIIDISRFDINRKASEEAIVNLPGYKDVIVLLPTDKLIYDFKH